MSSIIISLVNLIGKTNPEFSNLQLKKMEYGLVCFFNEITKLIPYYIIFYFLGLHKHFLIALLFLSSLRLFTGGYHAQTYWGCFFISFIILSTIIFIGKTLVFNFMVSVMLLTISFILVYIYSPVDNINKRILSNKRRLRLKYISIVLVAFLSFFVLIVPIEYKVTAVTSIISATLLMMIGVLINKLENYNNFE